MDREELKRLVWPHKLDVAFSDRRLRSCVCARSIHNYTVMPGNGDRVRARACCRCPEDCLCHMPGGRSQNLGGGLGGGLR